MRVILWGKVTQRHIDDADLLAGITPASYVTNGTTAPPASSLPVDVYPICDKQPETTRERANHYTLVHNADALICVGRNDHLVALAMAYGLPVYSVFAAFCASRRSMRNHLTVLWYACAQLPGSIAEGCTRSAA